VSDHAATWADAMRRARTVDPGRIAAVIVQSADTGLRATRYDTSGGRTTRVECRDGNCEDGEPGTHSHLVVSDPTGNAATKGRGRDSSIDDLSRLARADAEMIRHAAVVLDWVCGKRPRSWTDVVATADRLMPGTIAAGLDVDDERRLPHAITQVAHNVATVMAIAACHLPRTPTEDEQHWTAGLAPEDCCAWHLEIHDRYRRPRVGGTNVCGDCLTLAEILGQKPRRWLMEAMIDHGHRPIAWRASLSRAMDELGIVREAG
jgi:hypothetical protein